MVYSEQSIKMKKILYYVFLLTSALTFSACQNDDELSDGAAPDPNTLSSTLPSGTELVLDQDNGEEAFAEFSWTAVEFPGKKAKYSIEMDKAGNNFMNAKDILTTEELSASLTIQDINIALINFGIKPEETADVELRIRSWVDYLTTPGLSNSFTFTLTPYLLQFPPIYIIGDAQGWNLDNAVALTSTTPGVYNGQARFTTNGKFRFFALPDWGSEQFGWSYFQGGTIPEQLGDGADGDSNFLFGGVSADYKITVSLTSKSITLELAGPPPPPSSLFLVTAATVDLETAIEIESVEQGVYEQIVMLEKDTKFRIFSSRAWTAEKWAWGSFDFADELLQNSGDDVSNFLFTGETGYYLLSVNLDESTISFEASAAPQETLYLIGDPNSWNLSNAWAMRSLGNNTFEVTGTFQTNQIFRFFVDPDWSAEQYRWSSFTGGSVDADLADGGGGDSNFKFAAASGTYKLTVSLSNKSIVVDPAAAPALYIVGDDQGWNLSNAVSMTWLGGGKFEATTTFTNNSIFRFFETPAWDAVQWKYVSFASGTIDADLGDGGGADSNFRFLGTTGTHTITVDYNAMTVVIE
jgi:hypothetical protein